MSEPKLCLEYNPGPCDKCGSDGQEVVEGTFLCEECFIGPAGQNAQSMFNEMARATLVDMGVDAAEVAVMNNDEVAERGAKQLELLLMGAARN